MTTAHVGIHAQGSGGSEGGSQNFFRGVGFPVPGKGVPKHQPGGDWVPKHQPGGGWGGDKAPIFFLKKATAIWLGGGFCSIKIFRQGGRGGRFSGGGGGIPPSP